MVHIKALNQASKHGLKLKKVHRVIEFQYSKWVKAYEVELGLNILIFKTYITISLKHILIFRTYIIKFSKHILLYTKHILILRTDINCFFKQVLIFPYRYYLRCRCYRTCQQELSFIKQSGSVRNISYSKFHSTR